MWESEEYRRDRGISLTSILLERAQGQNEPSVPNPHDLMGLACNRNESGEQVSVRENKCIVEVTLQGSEMPIFGVKKRLYIDYRRFSSNIRRADNNLPRLSFNLTAGSSKDQVP